MMMMVVMRRRRRIGKVATGCDLTIRPNLIQSNLTSEVDMQLQQLAPSTQTATDSCFTFRCYEAVSWSASGLARGSEHAPREIKLVYV